MNSTDDSAASIEYVFVVDEDDAGQRLDVFLADQEDPPLSRSQIKKRIDAGEVTIGGETPKAGYTLRESDEVVWRYTPSVRPTARPQKLPLDILYEDDDLAIVDKPAGMVVHPAPGHPEGTLVNALLYHFESLAGVGGQLRPGIVHRIDKDTSGALVVTKNDAAHHHLARLFHDHDIERAYHALVFGPGLEDAGTFRTLHGRDPNNRLRFSSRVRKGRKAVTHWKVLERFASGACLVACRLETGRTHQIRMHFAEANAPLLGDGLYGGKATGRAGIIARQALHARTLGFVHRDGRAIRVEAPYPPDFSQALERLRAGADWR